MTFLSISDVVLAATTNWPGLPPDCWSEARIVHNIDNWKKLPQNFKIEKVKIEKPVKFENVSPNKGYSYKNEGFRPDVTISIYAEKDHLTVIKITDVFGVSDIKWINEKLLFIRIWWGRIAIDDVIFDVEKEAIVYTEPAVDGFQAYQQYKDFCKKLGGCKCINKEDSIAQIQDSDYINIVKKTKAGVLEKGLPDIVIPQWLENTFTCGGKATWEVNDCGEGGDGRTAPACVESIIPQQNGYYLHISIIVADTTGQKIAKPQTMMIYFRKPDGYKTLDLINVKTISEAIRLYKTDLSVKSK
ncbi:MAG: hypothetical protein FD156_547 [Nitrospirae bacterium]|nr:MAG: hypothetical protein FD156_547 [Nitrospirota bacterium]